MGNVEPPLRWIPALALDPDPGSAGMTNAQDKSRGDKQLTAEETRRMA